MSQLRNGVYGSKALYFLGLGVILIGLVIFSILFAIVFNAGHRSPILLVSFMNSFIVIWLMIFLRKVVYITLANDGTATVANVFFHKQITLDSTLEIHKVMLSDNFCRLTFDGRNYYFMTL